MAPELLELIRVVTTDAIKIIGPAVITAIVAFRTAKYQLEAERLRLHDKDKVNAYKELYSFARQLSNETFPMADNKRSAFKEIMRSRYFGKLQIDSIYFPEPANKILDELENRYVCMTRGELIPEMDEEDENDFLENQLSKKADELTRHVRKTMRSRGIIA